MSESDNTDGEDEGESDGEQRGISFWAAWLIPGVIPVAFCYLGLKLANYSIMLWLPIYAVEELEFDASQKALISTLYDVGTLAGSIILGLATDLLWGKRVIICFFGLILAFIGHIFLIFLDKE